MSLTKICPQCGAAYDGAVAFCATDGTRLIRGGQLGGLVGTVIADRYRIVSRIGEGGMGQVYLAEHVRMKRKSAIKIMRPALVGDIEALQRFTREAEHASQLSHPNIAAIFDFGETPEGVVYLAMEYVDGQSMGAMLDRDGVLHPDVAADILGQAADALQAAHDLNMLHRDIKPDNIMLGRRSDGTYMVKLVDFGIARSMDGSDQKVTRTGFAIGTPEYMSPEQLAGDTLNARSDQYALALVAFFALTGKQAFPSESSKESLIARLTSRPRTLQEAKRDVEWNGTLQEIFDRALSPEPHERFETVSDFAHAFSGAISAMTPTQTAELYRRALDTRVANVAARTPHSAGDSQRITGGVLSALPTPPVPRAVVSRASTTGVTTTDALASNTRGPAVTDGRPLARLPARSLWPWLLLGAVPVAAALWFAFAREARESPPSITAAPPLRAIADTATRVVVVPSGVPALTMVSVTPSVDSAKALTAKAVADSAKRAQKDSVKRDVARRTRMAAESTLRMNNVRARYPDAAVLAILERGVDAKSRMARNGDVRVTIMPTPMFAWRAAQARAWKDANPRPSGGAYEMVDPIEQWSAWSSLVTSRRAVYVLEVTPDKVPWPSYAPEKIFDIKHGDVAAVELLRDGAAVALDASAHIPALVNAAAHATAGRPVPNAFVATIPPTAFLPRDDGSLPKIELLVHDASRNGAITRVQLGESFVRRLYDDFAPWRDAIARP